MRYRRGIDLLAGNDNGDNTLDPSSLSGVGVYVNSRMHAGGPPLSVGTGEEVRQAKDDHHSRIPTAVHAIREQGSEYFVLAKIHRNHRRLRDAP
jgi:hypothetical protein